VVHHLETRVTHHLESRNDNIGLAWIYLNHKETETQTPVNVLASFLKQLTLGLKTMPSELQELYQYHHPKQTRPSPDQLLETFPFVISGYSKVYLIIDAFDEYPEDRRHLLRTFLGTMGRPTSTNPTMGSKINLMITSRPHVILDSFFSDVQTLDICAINSDISLFVNNQILNTKLSQHVKVQPNLQDEIRTQIIQKAAGM
jgi:hypothetical protein